MSSIHIIFDGPPGPSAPGFVEIEDDNGVSLSVGTWRERFDGLWELSHHGNRLGAIEGKVT